MTPLNSVALPVELKPMVAISRRMSFMRRVVTSNLSCSRRMLRFSGERFLSTPASPFNNHPFQPESAASVCSEAVLKEPFNLGLAELRNANDVPLQPLLIRDIMAPQNVWVHFS